MGLERRGIGFVLRAWPENDLVKFCEEISPCLVVGDENPIREPERWRQTLARKLRVPFWTVDADVIVPSHLLLKEQYGARTIRPRINVLLDEFLVPVGKLKPRLRWKPAKKIASLSPEDDLLQGLPINRSVAPVASLQGGTDEGLKLLKSFIRERLAGYDEGRNHPDQDHTSRLSPYLHFGHLGPHTVALAVKAAEAPARDREAFIEQMIVRRELAINFCRYNPNYDNLQCAEPWARRTLEEHARDEREYLYRERQLENAETHDPLVERRTTADGDHRLDARLPAHVLGQENSRVDAQRGGGFRDCRPPERPLRTRRPRPQRLRRASPGPLPANTTAPGARNVRSTAKSATCPTQAPRANSTARAYIEQVNALG